MHRFWWQNLIHRLLHWEYWPWQLIYLPLFFYYLYLALKARSLFFFSNANPGIESGGLLIESKYDILQKIDERYLPVSILINPERSSIDQILIGISKSKLSFPVMAKPNHGERGWLVEKINTPDELKKYISAIKIPFIVQEYIGFPLELGVFYYRMPGDQRGVISSITIKETLKVCGDGQSKLQELIARYPRARIQWKRLYDSEKYQLHQVIKKGQELELVPVGNHSLGATFRNGNHLISGDLLRVFDEISKPISGFYYGRFDLRCPDLNDLQKGQNIKILELNGAKSEPAHIYDPDFKLKDAYRVLFHHWNMLYKISLKNKEAGIPFQTFADGWKTMRKYLSLKEY